jgi:hypothetical protein
MPVILLASRDIPGGQIQISISVNIFLCTSDSIIVDIYSSFSTAIASDTGSPTSRLNSVSSDCFTGLLQSLYLKTKLYYLLSEIFKKSTKYKTHHPRGPEDEDRHQCKYQSINQSINQSTTLFKCLIF